MDKFDGTDFAGLGSGHGQNNVQLQIPSSYLP